MAKRSRSNVFTMRSLRSGAFGLVGELGDSDRAAALLSGAVIDNLVEGLVRKSLVQRGSASSQLLDGPLAPLSSFFARNVYLLETGVVSKRLFGDLEAIRKIRNLFAHEWKCRSFRDKRVAQFLETLEPVARKAPFGNDPRVRFSMAFTAILTQLEFSRKTVKKPRPRRTEPTYGPRSKSRVAELFLTLPEPGEPGYDDVQEQLRAFRRQKRQAVKARSVNGRDDR